MIHVRGNLHGRNHQDFIRWFTPQYRFAAMLGVPYGSLLHWSYRARIPGKHWLFISEVVAAAKLVNKETDSPITFYHGEPLKVLLFLAETDPLLHYPQHERLFDPKTFYEPMRKRK